MRNRACEIMPDRCGCARVALQHSELHRRRRNGGSGCWSVQKSAVLGTLLFLPPLPGLPGPLHILNGRISAAEYGDMSGGGGKIWLDDLQCTGEETALDDCGKHSGGWGAHNCGCTPLLCHRACMSLCVRAAWARVHGRDDSQGRRAYTETQATRQRLGVHRRVLPRFRAPGASALPPVTPTIAAHATSTIGRICPSPPATAATRDGTSAVPFEQRISDGMPAPRLPPNCDV
jgi:hypothetical protein